MCVCVYSFSYSFLYGLLQVIECSSLCYTVGLCCLSILYIVVCFYSEKVMAPTPVLLPGKSHGRRSLVGCSPWGR